MSAKIDNAAELLNSLPTQMADSMASTTTAQAGEMLSNAASMGAGFLHSGIGGPLDFAARTIGDVFQRQGAMDGIISRYGDLICLALERDPASKDALNEDDVREAVACAQRDGRLNLCELEEELAKLDRKLHWSVMNHIGSVVGGIGGGIIGAMIPGAGILGALALGAGGAAVGEVVVRELTNDGHDVRFISSAMMYESVTKYFQDGESGVDREQVFALMASRLRDPAALKEIEAKLGMKIEDALNEHNQKRDEGLPMNSKLAEFVGNHAPEYIPDLQSVPNAREKFGANPGEDALTAYARQINRGALDPRELVLGTLPTPQEQLGMGARNINLTPPMIDIDVPTHLPPLARDTGVCRSCN